MVGVRGFHPTNDNPYAYSQVVHQVKKRFPAVDVVWLPPFDEIAYGRDPGWSVLEVEVDEPVSASQLRVGMVVWITGQSGSGKTTLARNLKKTYLPAAIILDGDEMRKTISDEGFSKDDRIHHNLRVARLAGSLAEQGHVVLVSVIAPYRGLRADISSMVRPFWIYLPGASDEAIAGEWPYEPPDPDGGYEYLMVRPGLTPEESAKAVWEWLSIGLINLEQPR